MYKYKFYVYLDIFALYAHVTQETVYHYGMNIKHTRARSRARV